MMRRQSELISLLLILGVLCSTGFGLMCYNCLNPVSGCMYNQTCSPNLDACLIAVSGKQKYYQCWKFSDCNFQFISSRLELPQLEYRCCQKDLCNSKLEEEKNDADSLSGKTVLLVSSIFAAVWSLRF